MTIGPPDHRPIQRGFPQLFHNSSRLSLDATDDYPSFSSDDGSWLSFDSSPEKLYTTPMFGMPRSVETDSAPAEPDVPAQAAFLASHPQYENPDVDHRYSTATSQADSYVPMMATAPTVGAEYVRFALDQITSPHSHNANPAYRAVTPSSASSYPVERAVDDEGLGYLPATAVSTAPLTTQTNRNSSVPEQSSTDESSHEEIDLKEQPLFIPCDAPEASFKHQPLKYRPTMLSVPVLASYGMIALLAAALLIWGGIKTKQDVGLAGYIHQDRTQYFLFRILPQLLAGLFTIALQPVEAALTRVAPFVALTSKLAHVRSRAHFIPLYKSNYLLPRVTYFLDGLYLIGISSIVFWLNLFTVPLLSALFQIRLSVNSNNYLSAYWTANQVLTFFLAGLYLILAMTLFALAIFFLLRSVGLKWFPTSIADILTLVRNSNLSSDFAGTEIFQYREQFRSRLAMRSDRLGYWRTEDQAKDIFYGIGEEGEAPRRFSVMRGKTMPKGANESSIWGFTSHLKTRVPTDPVDTRQPRNVHSPYVRFAYIPWFLTDGAVVAWIVISVVLWVALIAASFVKNALPKGFEPLLTYSANETGFSAASFVYSFVPSFLGMIIFLCWQSVDTTYRALQPWANLATKQGAKAEETLLLDYTVCPAMIITVRAILLRHWRVAYFSFVTLVVLFVPILAGGMFLPLLDLTYSSHALVRLHMPTFAALLAFLTIAVLSTFALFPTRKRYLPHSVQTLSEVISFLYASPLLDERPFRDPVGRTDMVTKLVGGLTGDGAGGDFAFGVFIGRDGREHLGVDRVWRDIPEEEGSVRREEV